MSIKEYKLYTGHVTLESMSNARWYNNWTISAFKSHLQGDILEIGCGIGSFTKMLVDYGNVYAFDTDEDCIEQTRQAINSKGNIGFGDIENGAIFLAKEPSTQLPALTYLNILNTINKHSKTCTNY